MTVGRASRHAAGRRDRRARRRRVATGRDLPRRARSVPARARRAGAGAGRRATGACFRSGPSGRGRDRPSPAPGGPLERIWPTVTAPEVVRDLLNSRQRLAAAARGAHRGRADAALRASARASIREEPWTAADMPLLDEADAALRGVTSSYGYVLADEAQDLSPMQLRMVFRRSSRRPRHARRRHRAGDGPDAFRGLGRAARCGRRSMPSRASPSWRSATACRGRSWSWRRDAASAHRAGHRSCPRAVREGPEDPRLVQRRRAATCASARRRGALRASTGERTVGVIVAGRASSTACAALLAEAGSHAGDVLTDGLARQVTVLSAEQAKGLEFDHVVVVEPAAIAGPDEDWAYVYIALTRATRTLSVLYTHARALRDSAEPEPQPEPAFDGRSARRTSPRVEPRPPAPCSARATPRRSCRRSSCTPASTGAGRSVPYLAHLQAVAALVLEDGGSEDEAIAALLHDAVEDHGAGGARPDRRSVRRRRSRGSSPAAPTPTRSRTRRGASARSSTCASSRAPGRRSAASRSPRSSTTRARCCATTGGSATGSGRGWTSIPRICSGTSAALADLFVTERPGRHGVGAPGRGRAAARPRLRAGAGVT